MCELARNSVIQSGWEGSIKNHWLGHQWEQGINDPGRTNVPDIRVQFRQDTLRNELATLKRYVDYGKSQGGEPKAPEMTPHDTVGLAGFTEPAKLQQHIQHERTQHIGDSHGDSNEDINNLTAFPGMALAAERAKRKTSLSGKPLTDE